MSNQFPTRLQRWVLLLTVFAVNSAVAQSAVEQNSNVVGMTPAGHYRGIPGMQDNEPSCAINPILPRNIACAWNGSGGSDDLIGDTWIRFSESIDGGRTFFNRYLNGSNLDLATSIGQQFAADPVMMCWPGGCGTIMLASTRGESGGVGGGIYMQMMADFNTETGFRKAFKVNVDQIYRSTGSHFADKPHAIYVLNEDDPGVVDVTMTVETPTGGTETITRQWPKARIIVAFALFNPSKTDIELLSTHSDDYGATWSNPKQVATTSGRDQGVSLAAVGDTHFYGYRRFEQGNEPDSMMGVVVTRDGTRIGKPFEIDSQICPYDVPTLPSATNSTAAAARTNDFPWVSQNGTNFIMVYSERKRSSDGSCLGNTSEPSDSRIMAVVGSSNGRNWSNPVEVAPNAVHGFQFMPTVECSLGVCQIAWWDTRRDSARTRAFLQNGTAAQQAALVAFENLPIFADFQFPTGNGNEVIQFRRTADMFTKKFQIAAGQIVMTPDEPVLASRYRLGLYNGEVVEREFNPAHVKAYKSNTVPFTGDYNSLTSVKHRFVFDPDDPTTPPFWQENASPDPQDPNADPLFWLSWTDGRNMRGQLYTSAITGRPPFTRTPGATLLAAVGESVIVSEETPQSAESVEDSNPGAISCAAIPAVPAGTYFEAINNRVKDADIYGALIENRVNAWSLNPTKTLGNIQRTYTIVAENEDTVARTFRFEIANQPLGYPATARASWDQLPFNPSTPEFATTAPDLIETEDVGPNSSVSVALFVVSVNPVNPIGVRIFNDDTNELINVLTINGSVESGPLLNPNGTINDFELHNPLVFAPDQFNPDQFNPDQYNPDQFNPDLYNPDQFNPDQFNPDQFNPDQYNPDQFNPDQFNPDQFNPDQFNPDQFNPDQYNPDQYNSALTDSASLHNPEIPNPDPVLDALGNPVNSVVRLDINFGIQNVGNTLTPYSVDFALSNDQVLALIANNEISSQLIAWQDKQISDVQFCEPALISENRVIAAVNNPDLTQLNIPDIQNNRVGALTYFIAPGDILQNTLRFIGPPDKIAILAAALEDDIISYVFASQAANTDELDLGLNREQVINDRTPAAFNLNNGDVVTFEATSSAGALLPADLVTASKPGEVVSVDCTPGLGSTVGLDVLNNPAGPTALSCSATTSNNVTAVLNLLVSVLDTGNPTIDVLSVPADFAVEATESAGAIVNYSTPVASDLNNVDPDVDVTCTPAAGSLFGFSPPSQTTTVQCIAEDDSLNTDTASFDVTVQDTLAPVFDLTTVPANISAEATQADGAFITFTTPSANDVNGVDTQVDISCSPASGSLFPYNAPDPTTTTVNCDATDDSGNSSAVQFDVTVQDSSAPVIDNISPPIFDQTEPFVLDANTNTFRLTWGPVDVQDSDPSLDVSCSVGVLDLSQPLYTFVHDFGVGTTTVTCTATDSNGNSASGSFDVTIVDQTAPTITLIGDTEVRIQTGSPPYVDAGATATDNGVDISSSITIDSSAVDTTTNGTYLVYISASDASGNSTTVTRTVIVEFSYAGSTGIIPTKLNLKLGSANPLHWAWLDAAGNPVNTSADLQLLSIRNCATGAIILQMAGDPGSSGFRFKADNYWQFNWDTTGEKGQSYCAAVQSSLSGQIQNSPPINLR